MTDDRPYRKGIYVISAVLLLLLASIAFPLIESANTLGFLGEKSYLVILSDNTEIRNTGGLMACIGLLNVSDGAITGFSVYSHDTAPFNTTMAVSGPESFLKFFNITSLSWSDVNVQYDFATFAPMMESSVQHELGWKVDGTIALDFTALAEIMKITGPLVVDNQTITSRNVVDCLHYATKISSSGNALTHLIRGLAFKISAQLHNESLQNSVALLNALRAMGDQKHVLLHVPGNALLGSFDDALSKPQGDYISVVDANLGAAYSDFAVNRSLTYSVQILSDGSQISHLTVTYDNQCWWNYTVFSTALVPAGATLFATNATAPSFQGALVSNYSGFTTFSSLVTIPANSTASVTYSYTLPRQLSASGVGWRYDLSVQKQAGINDYTVSANVTAPVGAHVLGSQGLGQATQEQGDYHATLIYR